MIGVSDSLTNCPTGIFSAQVSLRNSQLTLTFITAGTDNAYSFGAVKGFFPRDLVMKKMLAFLAAGLFTQQVMAGLLLQYDPLGAQTSGTAIAPAFVADGVSAGHRSQTGFEDFWINTDVLPVGRISSSPVIDLASYLSFSVGGRLDLETLTYSKRSYLNAGPTRASIRSSLDSFASDVDNLLLTPDAGDQLLEFDLNALDVLAGSVEFRIYFYDAPTDLVDWADLVSTASSGSGLTLNGATVPSPGTLLLLAFGLAGLILNRRRKLH